MTTPSPLAPTPSSSVATTTTPETLPSVSAGVTGVSLLTLLAALVAATVAAIGVYFQRKSGRESAAAARESAAAAKRSSEASAQSAKAAEDNVALNERIAVGTSQRAHQDALSKRYQEAAAQLGSDKAAVRLAGVYAMARLADDWPEQRVQCVDVLCAYLRMPDASTTDHERQSESQVRVSLTELIGEHLAIDHPASWCDCEINLSHSDIGPVVWYQPTFNRGFNLSHATVRTGFWISDPIFHAEAHFIGVDFQTKCDIRGASFRRDDIAFSFSKFHEGGTISFGPIPDNLAADFTRVVVDASHLSIEGSNGDVQQGKLILTDVLVAAEGKLSLEGFDFGTVSGRIYPSVRPGASIRVAEAAAVELPPTFTATSPDANGFGQIWAN